LLDWVPWCATR